MPRKKATATKAVRKSPAKKKMNKKAAKPVSYTQAIDKAYLEAKAAIKKQLIALEKENKQLKSQDSKLAKAAKATQKAIAALNKKQSSKASAKSQMNKAQKAQKANDAAIAANQKALANVAGQIQAIKQQLAQLISEEQNVIAFRKAKPATNAAPKAKNEKKEKKTKTTKASKATKPAKAKKVAETVAESNDFADDENQLALVMEEDFLGDDESMNEDDQL